VSYNRYVSDIAHACERDGCQLSRARELFEQAERLLEKRMEPTRALWCDQGEHPFSERDPGRKVITIGGTGADGELAEESRTTCGPCAANAIRPRAQITEATDGR